MGDPEFSFLLFPSSLRNHGLGKLPLALELHERGRRGHLPWWQLQV